MANRPHPRSNLVCICYHDRAFPAGNTRDRQFAPSQSDLLAPRIQCPECRRWQHLLCVGLPPWRDVDTDGYFCWRCQNNHSRKSRRFRDWAQLHQAIHDARHTSRNAQDDQDLDALRRVLIERRNEFQRALDRNAERAARRAAQRQQQREPDENERQDDDGERRHEREPRRDDAPINNARDNPDDDPDGNNPPDPAPPEPEVHRREATHAPVIVNVWQTNGPSTGTGGQNTTTHDGQDTESNMPWTSARIFLRTQMPTTLATPWRGLGYVALVWFILAYAWSALVVTPLSSTFICSRFLLGRYPSVCGPWGDSPGLASKPLLPQPSTGLFSDSLQHSPSLICRHTGWFCSDWDAPLPAPSETRHRPLRYRTTWNSVNFPSIERLQACSTHIRIFLRPVSQALAQLAAPKFQARITKDTDIDGAVAKLRSATEVDFESLDGILHDLSQAISEWHIMTQRPTVLSWGQQAQLAGLWFRCQLGGKICTLEQVYGLQLFRNAEFIVYTGRAKLDNVRGLFSTGRAVLKDPLSQVCAAKNYTVDEVMRNVSPVEARRIVESRQQKLEKAACEGPNAEKSVIVQAQGGNLKLLVEGFISAASRICVTLQLEDLTINGVITMIDDDMANWDDLHRDVQMLVGTLESGRLARDGQKARVEVLVKQMMSKLNVVIEHNSRYIRSDEGMVD
ncbi:hypothetical protein FDECE_4134 [Fusarium decemcellulare]|nr:hypothetical protein FDECE_4134 [Fusarium decemcellulare]